MILKNITSINTNLISKLTSTTTRAVNRNSCLTSNTKLTTNPNFVNSFHTTSTQWAIARAKKTATPSKSPKSKGKSLSDKRYQVIKFMLYGSAYHRMIPRFFNKGQEQHEVIERMWCLEKEREEVQLRQTLKNKYVSMREAMEALEKLDQRLFEEAVKKDLLVVDGEEKENFERFPVKLRVPTDTLPIEGYDEKLKSLK